MPDSSDLPPEACINALIQQLHETQAALLDAKLEASDNYREAEIWKGKYDSLEYQLTPNQQRAWFARLRYEELEAIHERAQEEVEKGKQARKTLNRKFDEMETECRHVKRQLTHTEAWAEEYKKLYENAEQQYVKELGKSDGSDEEIERLLVEKAKLIEELEQFWAETTRLRAERDELRSDLEGIMQDELPEIPYLRRQLAAAREEIEKLEKDLKETRTALTALENRTFLPYN